MPAPTAKKIAAEIFPRLGLKAGNAGGFDGAWFGSGPWIEKRTPIDGTVLARVRTVTPAETARAVGAAERAFRAWREVPAPRRGELARRLGEALRAHKRDLGRLITLETGKIVAEGEGEVQEMIDICDFATGLSRQLHGLTIASERPGHRMMEQWHPLGVVGIITAFNFPAAVWAWNGALAAVCGDATVWKPSEKAPLTAIACVKIAERIARACGADPAIFSLVNGDAAQAGAPLAADPRVPLVSATGSARMGRAVAETVARRLGRTLLELGGNNAVVVAPSADLKLALRALLFGAVGTAGQRCTTTRRLIVHESIAPRLVRALVSAYRQVRIGNPLDPATLMGPLIDGAAVAAMQDALAEVRRLGGKVRCGGERRRGGYVTPAIVEARNDWPVVQRETFAPILYVIRYRTWAEAIALNNAVPQGLSSAVFTSDAREAEAFVAATGSDCGLANVNLGTSGAEIGGAFGGEKETGGGRESGSDAWKAYMRRQTATINHSKDLPLAQGIEFGK